MLVAWNSHPSYVPPPQFSNNQFNIFPPLVKPLKKVSLERNIIAESHNYDLYKEAKRFSQKLKFDLVLVQTGGSEVNKPTNISEFDCPKCLLVGDTHHTSENPISAVIEYINQNSFDAVVSLYNKDHIKWIKALCKADIRFGWFPGLTVQDIRRELIKDRIPRIFFAGSWRRVHPRRKRLMQAMRHDNLPIEHHQLTRLGTAVFHSNSAISFNCSLNGDFNMRVYECLAASGFLLTDRLSELSGLFEHLVEDEDFVAYGCYEELADKAKYYLSDTQRALNISVNGHRKYIRYFASDMVINKFLDWILEDKIEQNNNEFGLPVFTGVSVARRLRLYETVQTLCLNNESLDLLLVGTIARSIENDLRAFNRCNIHVLNPKQEAVVASMDGRAHKVSQIASKPWSLLVCDRVSKLPMPEISRNCGSIFELAAG